MPDPNPPPPPRAGAPAPASAPAPHQVHSARPSLVIASHGPVLFGVWTGIEPRADDLRHGTAILLQRARARGGAALIVGLPPGMPLPNPEIRTILIAELSKLGAHTHCGATVIPGEGFARSALRAAVSTLQLLVRVRHPEKIFSTAKEAAQFVHTHLVRLQKEAPPADDLASTFEELTRQYWQSAPTARR
ncbi:MAG: hypothetical protein R3F14_17035 [Polyangiaceae bacterium]